MIIVDTNVLSEAMRERPDPRVAAWLDQQPETEMFTTAITKAEILYGIAISPLGRKRAAREAAAEHIFGRTFSGRILPFEDDTTIHYAQISAARRARGREMNQADAQIAAIASLYGAILATRNTPDFEDCGIRVVNPWAA